LEYGDSCEAQMVKGTSSSPNHMRAEGLRSKQRRSEGS
jgi:hypothetical protein